ncbi:MAG: PAS domain-containing protein [Rhodospirillales bacterium]
MQALFKIAGNLPLLRQIASASHDAVLVFDTRWRVSLCNGAALRLLGLAVDEAIGQPVWKVAPGIISYDQLVALSATDGADGAGGDGRPAASPRVSCRTSRLGSSSRCSTRKAR